MASTLCPPLLFGSDVVMVVVAIADAAVCSCTMVLKGVVVLTAQLRSRKERRQHPQYRGLLPFEHEYMPTSDTDLPNNNNAPYDAAGAQPTTSAATWDTSPLVVANLRFFSLLIFPLFFVELGVLFYVMVTHASFPGFLLPGCFSALCSCFLARRRMNTELARHQGITFFTSILWCSMFTHILIALIFWSRFIVVADSEPLGRIADYLFSTTILQFFFALPLLGFSTIGNIATRKSSFIEIDTHLENEEEAQTSPETDIPGPPFPSRVPTAWKKIKFVAEFLWPGRNLGLQACFFTVFAILIFGRYMAVQVPVWNKLIINDLEQRAFPYWKIVIFVLFRLLQSGLISNAQNVFWVPIGQYATRRVSVKMLKQLFSLSMSYHLNRKTGEVMRVLDRGTTSIINLVQNFCLTFLPVIFDVIVALVFFIVNFGVYYGTIVFITLFKYIYISIIITEWRTKFRRQVVELENQTAQIGIEGLLNYETVKYFTAEDFELARYDEALCEYNKASLKSSTSLALLNIVQNFVICIGLCSTLLLCAYHVHKNVLSVGDFALIYSYIIQLYVPLNWLGTVYRVMQQSLIDMEKLMLLMDEETDISDNPDARDIEIADSGQKKCGSISFKNVYFSYDSEHDVLSNISFSVPAGSTVALVGQSGGGKSTILRLLMRFFDIDSGSIKIDGQDIRQITQKSLRKAIGVVPQDCVLFNQTVMYNIRYARPEATDEEVYNAARAAQIHDRIMSFPNQYDTEVGERGLRLSGGERQRLAIARTILKNPPIIFFDEATSALDTTTEGMLQTAVSNLFRNRTILTIAHRLSTVKNATKILVIERGAIKESGTHDDLLRKKGVYHLLWTSQSEKNNLAKSSGASFSEDCDDSI